MVRTKEGGSVPGFIVISVILTLLLVGGIFWLRQYTGRPQVVQPPIPQQPVEPPVQSNQPAQSETQTNTNLPQPNQASQFPSGASLPQTGPSEDILFSAIMTGILAAAIIGYVRSRRQVAAF